MNTASATGTGQIPDKEDQMYVVTRDELYLVPTAEVPVTNLHRDEILDAAELPIRYAAYSPCFRREAGAAGKDTRGILRVHQFDKVEMVLFERPEDSPAALEWMTERAEVLLQRLGLAYRVLLMSTREMGFVQARKYDLEVWSPGVERWLEVSSCSNFRDYQARRMAIRYRPEAGAKPELVHTLNGSRPGPRPHRRRASSRRTSDRTARSTCPRSCSRTSAGTGSVAMTDDRRRPSRRPCRRARVDSPRRRTPTPRDAPATAPLVDWQAPAEPSGPAPGVRFAPHGPRLVAYILDGVILTVVFLLLLVPVVLDHRPSVDRDGPSGAAIAAMFLLVLVAHRGVGPVLPVLLGSAAARHPGCGRSACGSCATATASVRLGHGLAAAARAVRRRQRVLPWIPLDLRGQASTRLAGPDRRHDRDRASPEGPGQEG